MARRACSLLALATFAGAIACEETPQHKAERTLTATVTLSLEDTLAIDSAVALTIEGEKRIDQIFATLEAVVTASTSTRAEMLASRLGIEVQRRDRTVSINIASLSNANASIQGALKLRVPSDLKINAIERGDTTDIRGMEEALNVSSASHVRITGAQRDVVVGVTRGNAIVDAALDPGSSIEIGAQAGDVELSIPTSLSANVQALVRTNGTILPQHPQLPPFRGKPGQIYSVRIGDGLSAVALETGVGNIVIKTR